MKLLTLFIMAVALTACGTTRVIEYQEVTTVPGPVTVYDTTPVYVDDPLDVVTWRLISCR